MKRYDWLKEIRRLDPERDFLRIYRITATLEFPWDVTRGLELALYRTYAVPSIGLAAGGDGRVHRPSAEALRRHRAAARRGRRARLRQRDRPVGDPPHQPDAPQLRHQQR
ncbi:hypothetical protein GCM10020000_10150 [Streptomyces olivoverticillatus]